MVLVLNFNNNQSESYFSKLVNFYKNIDLTLITMEINFEPISNIDDDIELTQSGESKIIAKINNNIGNLSCSLFSKVIQKHFNFGFEADLNLTFYFKILLSFINDRKFVYSICSSLLSMSYAHILKNRFYFFIDTTPISHLLKGLILLNCSEFKQSSNVFKENAELILSYRITKKEFLSLQTIENLNIFFDKSEAVDDDITEDLTPLNKSLSTYYYNLSLLFAEKFCFSVSLDLGNLALNAGSKENDEKITERNCLNCFNIYLELSDFDGAYSTLMKLNSDSIQLECLKKFINKIFNSSSNDLKKLISYPFIGIDDYVDDILFQEANSFDFINTSKEEYWNNFSKGLMYFKVLYSWRLNHNNPRGACEALYHVINKYKYSLSNKTQKSLVMTSNKSSFKKIKNQTLIVFQLYSIILNLLKTFKETDKQWLLKHNLSMNIDKSYEKEYELVTLEELKEEFNSWTSEIDQSLKVEIL
ncbi:Nup120p ASCRUDRAFT_88971 [Ascoidea rubescens DSM 1968]|uniref:Nucleoporin nup120-like HEAT repeat domain-containing protein n=1 Tax=Ascoidea rubescens DSM 1968 TaxID=1344418 RepID=A0A1D2VPC9_9ASCO|nr:hypothetical protein ASCRUDRAFT_88971 [Ascoidea rubescens DSM 1968]ODV63460.1 hypothetical protein ASCRUDRAFT_88971 [Ascoidea rubescens DSM 1968]